MLASQAAVFQGSVALQSEEARAGFHCSTKGHVNIGMGSDG